MQVNAGKLQILTVAAMLVLISGGIAAYAQNPSAWAFGGAGASTPAPAQAGGSGDSNSSIFASTDTETTFTTTITTTTTLTTTVTTTLSTSTSTTSTTSENHTLCQPPGANVGRLVLPITATGPATGSISFADGRGCSATITTEGGVFDVQIVLRYAKPLTQYEADLVANGTSYTLGNLVTLPGGNGQMDNQVLLKPGTYVVSIQIYDTSSNPGQSTLVLQTGQGTIVSPPFSSSSGGQGGQQPPQGGQGGQGGRGGSGGQGGQGGSGGQGGQGQSGKHR